VWLILHSAGEILYWECLLSGVPPCDQVVVCIIIINGADIKSLEPIFQNFGNRCSRILALSPKMYQSFIFKNSLGNCFKNYMSAGAVF
jgi:hypothetical protein